MWQRLMRGGIVSSCWRQCSSGMRGRGSSPVVFSAILSLPRVTSTASPTWAPGKCLLCTSRDKWILCSFFYLHIGILCPYSGHKHNRVSLLVAMNLNPAPARPRPAPIRALWPPRLKTGKCWLIVHQESQEWWGWANTESMLLIGFMIKNMCAWLTQNLPLNSPIETLPSGVIMVQTAAPMNRIYLEEAPHEETEMR